MFESFIPRIEVQVESYVDGEVILNNGGLENGTIGFESVRGIIFEGEAFEESKSLLMIDGGGLVCSFVRPIPAKGCTVMFAFKLVNLTADMWMCIVSACLTTKIGATNYTIKLGYSVGPYEYEASSSEYPK
ncbi:MAG: hypothetical protein NDF55_00890 [archaeon GB-1867-005]|nr:hypothetical protein [Candidatus Culexmicrobium cathedralense]